MVLFDMKDRNVVVATEALLIPEFKTIWDRDKSKDKLQAMKDLSYVYFIADYRSPYRTAYTTASLSKIVAKDFMKSEEYKPCAAINAALKKYEDLQRTPSMSLLAAAVKTVHNLTDYLESVDLTERDKNDRPVYKPADVTTSLKAIGGIVDSLRIVKEIVEKEITQSGVLRGQRKKGNREDPNK